jgi:hypothetical protein
MLFPTSRSVGIMDPDDLDEAAAREGGRRWTFIPSVVFGQSEY